MLSKVAALLLAVTILPAYAGSTSCQTSKGSPKTADVTATINELRGRGQVTCDQANGEGSDCTTLTTSGTAGIAVCGDFQSYGTGQFCDIVSDYANEIQQTCVDSDGYVGGTFTSEGSNWRVEVIHS